MFTLDTNRRFKKTIITYLFTTIFLYIFSRIYQSQSYGEVSFFMNYLFLIPFIGGILLSIILKFDFSFSRLSFNLWNSGVAVVTAGFLLRGIINLSGRSTTFDKPYFYIGTLFLVVAIINHLVMKVTKNK